MLLFCVSCQDENDPIYTPEEQEEVLITDVSGSSITNTQNIVLGVGGDDTAFEMSSTVMNEMDV